MKKMHGAPPELPAGIHLNLGCGAKLWPGFVNIDFNGNWSGRRPDIECDLHAITLPDGYADSVYAIHVLEHFYRWETGDILTEWVRLLKPGGRLVIEVPCLDKVIGQFNSAIASKTEISEQRTMWRLYGDPIYKDPVMVHRWCFSVQELIALMEQAGLREVKYSEPEYHHPKCDMRISGVK